MRSPAVSQLDRTIGFCDLTKFVRLYFFSMSCSRWFTVEECTLMTDCDSHNCHYKAVSLVVLHVELKVSQ